MQYAYIYQIGRSKTSQTESVRKDLLGFSTFCELFRGFRGFSGWSSHFGKKHTLIDFNLPKQFSKIVMTYIGVARNLTNSSFLKVEKPTKGRGWKEVSAILVAGEMGRIEGKPDKDIGPCRNIFSQTET